MIESRHRTIDRALGMVQGPKGSIIIPTHITVNGPDALYNLSAHISWSPTHLNVVFISDTGNTPKYYVSDFRLTKERTARGARWKIVHREVDKRFTIEGTQDSVAKETVETLIAAARKLGTHNQYPESMYIDSSRPSLIRFFEKIDFKPQQSEHKVLFDMYMEEYKTRPREDFLQTDPTIGSRFLLVRESPRKDSVLVDKYHPKYDASIYGSGRIVHVAKPPIGKPFNKEPYVIRVTLTHEL